MAQKMLVPTMTAARAVAAVSAFFWAGFFFGIIDLAVPIEETPGFYDAYLLETGWGVLYTFLVGAAFISLAVRPEMVMPVVQVLLVAACLGVTGLAAASWGQLVPAILLAANGYMLSFMVRDEEPLLPAGWYRSRLDPAVCVAAVILVPPAVWFAGDMVLGYWEGRPPVDDDTWGIDHWPTQAALALAIAAVALTVAAGVRARWSGTVVCVGCVAVSAGWFGYWSVIYPHHAGSAGEAPGKALLVWAGAFAGLAWWRLASRRGHHPMTTVADS